MVMTVDTDVDIVGMICATVSWAYVPKVVSLAGKDTTAMMVSER